MYTLELGQVNAGFIFFIAALLSTLLFGRFFCGWACHVVSLQDFCSYLLGKVNIRPKPFRTRLLIFGPFLIALYMFVWPTFKRTILFPLLTSFEVKPPGWLEAPPVFPGFSNHLTTSDFWATFPPWYIAVPFLFICGFVCVYFLGSKGFCTYACPYGGFFAPLDKLSIGKIVVNDDCEGCGHCTAVCTSNVRVHQEVRDYGKVVDPGCMKCLDCVSVCPNGALSFAFAAPSLLTKIRPTADVALSTSRPRYDLSLPVECLLLLLGILYFLAFRGMLDSVPLLLAGALAALGVYGAAKMWQLATTANVRARLGQLKLHGTLRAGGYLAVLLFVAYSALAAWSGFINFHRWQGDLADQRIFTSFDQVFSPGYTPSPADKALAASAISHFERSGSPRDASTGLGWKHQPKTLVRLSWFAAVAGNRKEAQRYLTLAIDRGQPSSDWIFGLARLHILDGHPELGLPLYQHTLARFPGLHDVRIALAIMYLRSHDGQLAIDQVNTLVTLTDPPPDPIHFVRGSEIMIDAGNPSRALELMTAAVAAAPNVALLHAGLHATQYFAGQTNEAILSLQRACDMDPANPGFLSRLVALLQEAGRIDEAAAAEAKLRLLLAKPSPSTRTPPLP